MMDAQRTLRRVGLMAGSSLLALAAIGPAASPALAKPSGSIWTTSDSCSVASAQNGNSYLAGETLYVRGSNFAASSAFSWSITGKPGGASGDPNEDVATGNGSTDAAGAFCVAAYVIAADDWGEYSVDVEQGSTSKKDNYRVARADAQDEDGGDVPSDSPSDDPGDEPGAAEAPAEEDTTPPSDEGTTAPSEEGTTPPPEEQTVEETNDSTIGVESNAIGGSNDQPFLDVLGAVSGGQTVTPPPTDTLVAPSDQSGGSEWRLILVFLGILVLAATIGLPERRRAA